VLHRRMREKTDKNYNRKRERKNFRKREREIVS
jgi:hypothetical protein